MALATSLDAPLSPQRTNVFLLALSHAGDETSLPPSEIERTEAETLAPSLRAPFLARRRLLRRAVALRLGIAPGDVLIARDANGAPRVTSAREPVFVSVASRGGLLAIAVSERPVGVDIEAVETAAAEPAWNILHPREREWLTKQPAEKQAKNFLALWCAKEAYLKAIGVGLQREPNEIAIFLRQGDRLAIEDAGRPAALDTAFVTDTTAQGAAVILACVALTR